MLPFANPARPVLAPSSFAASLDYPGSQFLDTLRLPMTVREILVATSLSQSNASNHFACLFRSSIKDARNELRTADG